jgi:hypothetical protein
METRKQASVQAKVAQIFSDVVSPPIHVDSHGKIQIPQQCALLLGKSKIIYSTLDSFENYIDEHQIQNQDKFDENNYDLMFCNAFLETACLVVKNVYDAIRLRSVEKLDLVKGRLTSRILRLLHLYDEGYSNVGIFKRLVRFFQQISLAGVSAVELHSYLQLMQRPSRLTTALLQTLLKLVESRNREKAAPDSFFCFFGRGSVMTIPSASFPFTKEMQVDFWFRIDEFNDDGPSNSYESKQSLLRMLDLLDQGIDVYLENRILCVNIASSPIDSTFINIDGHPLEDGRWYHFTLQCGRVKYSLFGSDEITVLLDDDIVYSGTARLPTTDKLGELNNFTLGKNLKGQIGMISIYINAWLDVVYQ